MSELMINAIGVGKKYRTGQIGSTTLSHELQRLSAKIRGKEDPNSKIGTSAKEYGKDFWALKDISFKAYKGERIGIIGHNGAGKSTLLKLITKITMPTEGAIGLNGTVASMLEVGTGFHQELTGRENIYLNGAILGMSKAEVDRKIRNIIEFSECGEFIDTPVKRYSSGMYVKLAFAVAANLDSDILIMDEVLAVGDLQFQRKCIKKMASLSTDENKTILYVSHNMSTIRELCSRCIVLDHGRIIYDGDVEAAIGYYLNASGDENRTVFDLDSAIRHQRGYGTAVRLTELSFPYNETAYFDLNKKMRFRVKLRAFKDMEALRLYFILDYNGVGQGLAQTYEPFCDIKAGEDREFDFSFDLSNLAEGRYGFYLNLFYLDYSGEHVSLDYPGEEIWFNAVETGEHRGIIQTSCFPRILLAPIEKENK